jgi:glycosyltransferase involved in cell wall biosynthesis
MGSSKEGVFIGGAVNSLIRLSQGLSERHHQISIVTTPPRLHNAYTNVPWANVQQIPTRWTYPSIGYGFEFAIKALSRIRKLHKKEDFQIIHGHSGCPSVGLVSGTAGKLINTPSIHTLYCPVNSKDRFAKLYLSQIDMIIAMSENIKKSLERIKIPAQKIKVIPPAINTAVFNPLTSGKELREKLKIDKNDKVILFVGNLTKTKGIDILLEAMKSVTHQFPEVKLLMTSELHHEDYEKREEEIKIKIEHFGLKNHIVRFGIIKNMAELVAASDLLVAPFLNTYGPSDYPLPVLEAMGVGKPAIATNIGGIPEIISNMENGVLIEPMDVNSLSKAIITLLEDDKLRHKLGKNASTFVLNNFSIERISRKMEVVYEEVKRQ